MATRAYIVNVIDENQAEIIYNNFDGGEYLNKALNRNKIDPDDIFAGRGDIRSIDLETGDIERYKEGGSIFITGEDLSDILNQIVGETGNVNYLQVFDPKTNGWVMIKRSIGFDRTLVNLFDIYGYLENNDMNENYEIKWKRFINEEDDQLTQDYYDIEERILTILKDKDKSLVDKYLETVKYDFHRDFHDGIEKYYTMEREDIIDDFDNYIFGDLDI